MSEQSDFESAKDAIKVYLRLKPLLDTPHETKEIFEIDTLQESDLNVVDTSGQRSKYSFSGIFPRNVSQAEVFETMMLDSVKSLLEGYNSTVFAYGQTGSGKTFTITGASERFRDRGLIPRTITFLFKSMCEGNKSQENCTIRVSYLEIYNEMGFDLLSKDLTRVKSQEDEYGNLHFLGLRTHVTASEEAALNLLLFGDMNRTVCETTMNATSSRSHCVFCIMMQQKTGEMVTTSKLNIVDLAGSERVCRSFANGRVLEEAKFINTSLHFLEMVILALKRIQEKAGRDQAESFNHVPYRNSMLTQILRDSLGGNSRTAMVATVSSDPKYLDESISTFRFAQRVREIVNTCQRNVTIDPFVVIDSLKQKIATLKEENSFLMKENRRLGSGGADDTDKREYSEEEIEHEYMLTMSTWLKQDEYCNFPFGFHGFSFHTAQILIEKLWKHIKAGKGQFISEQKLEAEPSSYTVIKDTVSSEEKANKMQNSLEEKINDAKNIGKEIKTLRNKMLELKGSIEKIRLQKEIFNSNLTNESLEELQKTNEILEKRECDAIDRIRRYKGKCQVRFEKLATLKQEIEFLQRSIKSAALSQHARYT